MGPSDPKKDSQPNRRRAGGVLAMEDFARRKGVTKAIHECRQRQDKKRTATAKALRSYRKTMKQEGYQPGQGASRKRKLEEENSNDQDTTNNAASDKNDTNTDDTKDSSCPIGKRKKTNPFQQSLRKAEQTKQQRQQQAIDKEEREKERDQKLKERRKRSKQLRQRTAKGQPVMKHVIHDILRKLEREKEQEKGQEGKTRR
jgi:rRNA processing